MVRLNVLGLGACSAYEAQLQSIEDLTVIGLAQAVNYAVPEALFDFLLQHDIQASTDLLSVGDVGEGVVTYA